MSDSVQFVVMATIHGPDGWHDVVDTKYGHMVAVCPKRCFALKIATLLNEQKEMKK